MRSFYDAIYLSPHLDDAVLSCGGQIYQLTQAGGTALIVSIMAGDPPSSGLSDFAQSLHQRWELALNASAIRREEDVAAIRTLGADYHHLDLMDCIYRKNPAGGLPLYDSEESLFGDLHPAENSLVRTLAHTLAELPETHRVIVPMTVGNHVDHQLTRLAAETWRDIKDLIYYEEFPYMLSPSVEPADLVSEACWQPQVVVLESDALAMRIKAIACYRSQLSTFFRDHNDLVTQVSGYVHDIGGERLWRYIAL